jgi:uncharacterized protein
LIVMRQIFLIVLFVLAARWLVRTMRAAQTATAARTGTPRGAGMAGGKGATRAQRGPRQLAEPMVRCAACGVHAPKSDSVFSGARYFCSAEHAQRYAPHAGGREGR